MRGLLFVTEKNTRGVYTNRCHNGKIIEQATVYPEEIKQFMDGSYEFSAQFKQHVRFFNSVLSFASMGAQIVPHAGKGPYCFRIHGQIYHRTSHLLPPQLGEEKKAQLYVLDSDLATLRRMEHRENSDCNPELILKLDEMILRVNPYADAFNMMWEREQQII